MTTRKRNWIRDLFQRYRSKTGVRPRKNLRRRLLSEQLEMRRVFDGDPDDGTSVIVGSATAGSAIAGARDAYASAIAAADIEFNTAKSNANAAYQAAYDSFTGNLQTVDIEAFDLRIRDGTYSL